MDAKWLNQQFLNNPSKNKGDLSEALGIQASGISKMLAGTRQIKAKEYLLMRKFFDIPGSGHAVSKKTTGIHSYADLRAEDSASQVWGNTQNGYQVVEVSDTAMVPDFLPGERVLVDTASGLSGKAGVFAIQEQGQSLIRFVESSSSKLKISASSKDIAPRLLATGKVKIIGRVIAKLNWL